jgi:hypothetical protein
MWVSRPIPGALGSKMNVGTSSIGVGVRGRRSVVSALSFLPPHGDSILQVPTTEDDFQMNAVLYHRPPVFSDKERLRWMDGDVRDSVMPPASPLHVEALRFSGDFDTVSTQQHQQCPHQCQGSHCQHEGGHLPLPIRTSNSTHDHRSRIRSR